MAPQSNASNPSSIALVINLASSTAGQGVSALTALLDKLSLPATWVIEKPGQAKVLSDAVLSSADHELALAVTARSPQRLRSELANLQAAVQEITGFEASVVAGDAQQLRSRAALLADLGIGSVISDSLPPTGPAKPPRQLPCGLWQFDPAMTLPQPRHRWSWLTARRPTLKRLTSAETAGDRKVLAIDLAQANDRETQSCGQLLREIAAASRQGELRVATVSLFAAELADRRVVKPQRSILRRAA